MLIQTPISPPGNGQISWTGFLSDWCNYFSEITWTMSLFFFLNLN